MLCDYKLQDDSKDNTRVIVRDYQLKVPEEISRKTHSHKLPQRLRTMCNSEVIIHDCTYDASQTEVDAV